MKRLWVSSPIFPNYDPTRDLYEQLWDIIEKKLEWYTKIFPYERYQRSTWEKYTLNERYSAITTITLPYVKLEEDIKKCKTEKDKEDLFNNTIWHIPYYVKRGKYHSNKSKFSPEEQKHKNRLKCPPNIEEVDREWYDEDFFEIYGRALNTDNIRFYINNKYEDYEVYIKRFIVSKNEKVTRINDLLTENNNIVDITLKCTALSIEHCENLFKDCKSLIKCDLSKINLNYCESFENMFRGCSKLQEVNFSELDLNVSDPDTTHMFLGCNSLKKIIMKNCSNSTIIQMKCILNNHGLDNIEIIQ